MSFASALNHLDFIVFAAVLCAFLWLLAVELQKRISWEWIDQEIILARIDHFMFNACKVVVALGLCVLFFGLFHAWYSGAIERATTVTIDTAPPAPLVPCAAYSPVWGDSITSNVDGYTVVELATNDPYRCSADLADFQVAR